MSRIAIAHGSHAVIGVVAVVCAPHTPQSLSRRMNPPRIAGGQHVPLWKMLSAPRRQLLKSGPPRGPIFFTLSNGLKSTKARNEICKVENLLVVHRRQHFGHAAIVAAPIIGFV